MKKDIRFLAVDSSDENVQTLLSNSNNAYTELDKSMFDNHFDGIYTGSESFDNITMIKGRLMEDPELLVSHTNGDTKFVFAKLVVRDGYFDLNGKHHEHSEVIPLRFFKHLDQIMRAKKGDAVQVTGSLKTYVDNSVAEEKKAGGFFYVSVKSFGIMFGAAVRKQVKAKFEPKQNNSAKNNLTDMIANASPEERAQILAMLQSKPVNQNKDSLLQTGSDSYSEHSQRPQNNSENFSTISQEDLRNAMGDSF